MKLTNHILVAVATITFASCAKWTEPERKTFPEHQGPIERITPEKPKVELPLIDIRTEDQLSDKQREYFAKVREERKKPHVRGFGWYGNWTGLGKDPMKQLKMLPDGVDFVSIWGTRPPLTKAQQEDLKFFQKVNGGKALLCWIVQDLGGPLTPVEYKGREQEYWLNVKGGGDKVAAARAYANALCDSIEKYNFDGFDIDYEPNYGHSGNLANSSTISPDGNKAMYEFVKTMYDRLHPKGRMLVFDGEPDCLSTEASKMIDFYIYQAYYESSPSAVLNKIRHSHLDKWQSKTIITVEFEKFWKNGGLPGYSTNDPVIQNMPGGHQLTDYGVLDLPNGNRIAGIGSYHMEYDKSNNLPYRWLRQALEYANKTKPGRFDNE